MSLHLIAVGRKWLLFTQSAILAPHGLGAVMVVDYEAMEALFIEHRLTLGVSEVHGIITGYSCVCLAFDAAFIVSALDGNDPTETSFPKPVETALLSLAHETHRQLREEPFAFQLLLPDDDEPLGDRAGALGHWSYGFLVGAALGGVTVKTPLDGEVKAVFEQYQEISQIDYESITETREEECDYMELVEYARLAAVMIYQEIHLKLQNQTPDSLH